MASRNVQCAELHVPVPLSAVEFTVKVAARADSAARAANAVVNRRAANVLMGISFDLQREE